MKPIFKEFYCPQCGELRYVNVNGICYDCKNENTLLALAKVRKSQQKFNFSVQTLNLQSYN